MGGLRSFTRTRPDGEVAPIPDLAPTVIQTVGL